MAQPLRLFMARHGQTEGARGGRFCGDIDVPLDAEGLEMAEAIGRHYGAKPWRALYSSPLSRACATAAPLVARTRLPLQIDDGLREIAYGAWEGLLEADAKAGHPEEFAAWQADPSCHAPPGGETGDAIATRALAAIDRIRSRHPEGGDVMLFSHKATLRILVCRFLGIPVSEFRRRVTQPPGTVTIVDLREGGPLLLALADVRHLPPRLWPELGS
jgi:probable phosphoglycerate mutase